MRAPASTLRNLVAKLRGQALAAHSREGKLPQDLQRVGQQVQRLGERAFSRVLRRWPGLAELVVEPPGTAGRGRTPAGPRTAAPGRAKAERVPSAASAPDETALEVLCVQLVAASSWQQRASAAHELGHMRGDGVVQALTHALRDPSVEVAVAAVEALAQRSEPGVSAALRSVVDNSDGYFNPVTRVGALSVLGRSLSDCELGPIVACVRDLDAEVSIAAIAVVASRRQGTAAEHLVPILEDQGGYFLPLVRLAAANALTQVGALGPALASQLLEHEQAPAVRCVLERAAGFPPSS